MDYDMVLRYNYSNRNRWRRRTNAPLLRAISMAMAVRRCHTKRIAQCSMTRKASPEATGRRHRATTHSVLPIGRQGDNQLNDDATCTQFVGHFNGHCNAAVLYHTHRPMEEVCGFH